MRLPSYLHLSPSILVPQASSFHARLKEEKSTADPKMDHATHVRLTTCPSGPHPRPQPLFFYPTSRDPLDSSAAAELFHPPLHTPLYLHPTHPFARQVRAARDTRMKYNKLQRRAFQLMEGWDGRAS